MAKDLAALVRDRFDADETAQTLPGTAASRGTEGMPVDVDGGLVVLNQDALSQPDAEIVASPGVAIALTSQVGFEVATELESDHVLHGPAVQIVLQLGADHIVGRGQDGLQLDPGWVVSDATKPRDLGHRALELN
jgi:hypothetical protein